MSYINKVKIYIEETQDVIEKMGNLENIKSQFENGFSEANCIIGKNSNGCRVIKIDITDTRWCGGFSSLNKVKDKLEQLNDSDYVLARLGEEIGDFEKIGNYSDGEIYVYSQLDDDFIDFIENKEEEIK